MSFQCPQCSVPGSLNIVSKIELPPDSRSDEITLQVIKCPECGFSGIAVYEESRRGSFDSESFDHTGYYIDTDDLKIIEQMIKRCPKPVNPQCMCSIHRKLGSRNSTRQWNGLDKLHLKKAFNMNLS